MDVAVLAIIAGTKGLFTGIIGHSFRGYVEGLEAYLISLILIFMGLYILLLKKTAVIGKSLFAALSYIVLSGWFLAGVAVRCWLLHFRI